MKGKRNSILVMVGLLSLSGWSARAEPPVAPSAGEITREDATLGSAGIRPDVGSGTRGSRTPSPEQPGTHEPQLHEHHEAVHRHDLGTHAHGADTLQHDDAGEHMAGSEGMGSHLGDMVGPMGEKNVEQSRAHESARRGEPAEETTSGNASGQGKSMMGPAGGMADGAMTGMHHDDGMMGSGTDGKHDVRMRGGH